MDYRKERKIYKKLMKQKYCMVRFETETGTGAGTECPLDIYVLI
jgi:hypothetical protein